MENSKMLKLLASDPAGYDAIKGKVLKSFQFFLQQCLCHELIPVDTNQLCSCCFTFLKGSM